MLYEKVFCVHVVSNKLNVSTSLTPSHKRTKNKNYSDNLMKIIQIDCLYSLYVYLCSSCFPKRVIIIPLGCVVYFCFLCVLMCTSKPSASKKHILTNFMFHTHTHTHTQRCRTHYLIDKINNSST